MEGTIIEITVTTPQGKNYCTNVNSFGAEWQRCHWNYAYRSREIHVLSDSGPYDGRHYTGHFSFDLPDEGSGRGSEPGRSPCDRPVREFSKKVQYF